MTLHITAYHASHWYDRFVPSWLICFLRGHRPCSRGEMLFGDHPIIEWSDVCDRCGRDL